MLGYLTSDHNNLNTNKLLAPFETKYDDGTDNWRQFDDKNISFFHAFPALLKKRKMSALWFGRMARRVTALWTSSKIYLYRVSMIDGDHRAPQASNFDHT